MPEAARAVLRMDKITAYLLSETHKDGRHKGGFNWSSQHRSGGWCEGGEKAFGAGAAG